MKISEAWDFYLQTKSFARRLRAMEKTRILNQNGVAREAFESGFNLAGAGLFEDYFSKWFESAGVKVFSPVGDSKRKKKMRMAEQAIRGFFFDGNEIACGLDPDTHCDVGEPVHWCRGCGDDPCRCVFDIPF